MNLGTLATKVTYLRVSQSVSQLDRYIPKKGSMAHLFWAALIQTKISMLLSRKASQGLSTVRCVYDLQKAYGLLHFPQVFEHRNVFLGIAHENSVLWPHL